MELFLVKYIISTLTIACLLKTCEGRRDKYGNGPLNTRLHIPKYPKVGDRVVLGCQYDLGRDGSLYTVKWYRGPSEFYRYSPKESPPIKTFDFPGTVVDRTESNATQLVLQNATLGMSGKYSCEVTMDSTFTTEAKSEVLQVVSFPNSRPEISLIKPRYSVGDVVDINCTSYRSRPPANLTWYINSTPAQLIAPPTLYKERERDLTETSRLGLRFQLQQSHFVNSRVKLQCNATIFDRYQQSSEVTIYQADRPQISSVVDNYSSSSQSTNSNNNRLRSAGLPRSGANCKYSVSSFLSTGALLFSISVIYSHRCLRHVILV